MGITLQVQHHIDGLFDETVALLHNKTTMSRDDAIEAATEAMSGAAVVAQAHGDFMDAAREAGLTSFMSFTTLD